METWSAHQLYSKATSELGTASADQIKRYALNLIQHNRPVILTLNHLAKITNTNYKDLHSTVNRLRENQNYKLFSIMKRSGKRRFIHAPSKLIIKIHQFINSFILSKLLIHTNSYAYHKNGGIKKCASMHCGARWIFQFDLKDFFYTIPESKIYTIFKNAGYKNLLAFELARLCTTIKLPHDSNKYLRRPPFPAINWEEFLEESGAHRVYRVTPQGVLPQGAPTSPMLSNIAAYDLDEGLLNYATQHGLVYTRYADDLTFSCSYLSSATSITKLRREIIAIIRHHHFIENPHKIRIAGPGSRKIVLGLLVDGDEPHINKKMYSNIEKKIYYAIKFGLKKSAEHLKFDSAFGYYNHISGLISFLNDVDSHNFKKLIDDFHSINVPWNNII